jgi:mannobiose 2-epimerase
MVDVTAKEGLSSLGGIWNEGSPHGLIKDDYDWWNQAEAMVGFLNAYEITGNDQYFALSIKLWDFVRKHFIDYICGEWFWSIDKDLKVNERLEKVGPWKCPYHNARACFEISQRLEKLLLNKGVNCVN